MTEEKKENLAHNNYPYGSEMPIGSRDRSLYENKKESFLNGLNAAINYTHSCETVANKENKDFFKWVESEKIERISDFYFLIGNKKHTYNYVKKKYRMYLQKKQMFY